MESSPCCRGQPVRVGREEAVRRRGQDVPRLRAGARARDAFVLPHVRISAKANDGRRYLPSQFELANALAGVGRLAMCKFEIDPTTRVPVSADVTFERWIPHEAVDALAKVDIPKCQINVNLTPEADRARMAELVASKVLTERELDCLARVLYGGGATA